MQPFSSTPPPIDVATTNDTSHDVDSHNSALSPLSPLFCRSKTLTGFFFFLQGIEAAKQLLEQAQPYRLIMGARDLPATQAAVDGFAFDRAANPVSLLPLDLSDLRGVRAFARSTLDQLGPQGRIDYLFLNAGMLGSAEKAGPHGTKWCESYVVNHLCELRLDCGEA